MTTQSLTSVSCPDPSFLRSPKSSDSPPPGAACFFLLLLCHPYLASEAFLGFLGASPVAKRQQSVPLLFARMLHGLVAGEEAARTKQMRSPHPRSVL